MESIWEKTCKGPARPPLYGKAQADVAVIGGGMTGILTALELQERGLQVVVAEAGHVGGGQTAARRRSSRPSTGQSTPADRAARPGKGGDVRAGQPARRGALLRAHRAGAHRLRSGARGLVALLLRREDALLREAEAERALGLDASFEPDTPLPLRVCGRACGCAGRRSSIR